MRHRMRDGLQLYFTHPFLDLDETHVDYGRLKFQNGIDPCYLSGIREATHGFGSAQHSPALAGSSALASIATFQSPLASFFQIVM